MKKALALLLGFVISLSACQLFQAGQQADSARQSEQLVEDREKRADVVLDSSSYQVTFQMTLLNEGPGQPSKHNLWVALIQDVPPYQDVHNMQVSPGQYQLSRDEYGNHYAEFDLADLEPGQQIDIQIGYQVTVHQLAYPLEPCQGELLDDYTQAELHIEADNPQIKELAAQLAQNKDTSCETARAIYNYIGDRLTYSYNQNDWGAQAALGEMGADCTEYASLMIALSRANGIPARYFEGLLYQQENEQAEREHAWLEVYLPGIGWAPMDPTLGRSSIFRDEYFARIPPTHLIITQGRNPSTLRGSSYWTHLYWPGGGTSIKITDQSWTITPLD